MDIARFHIELDVAVDKRDNSAVPELSPELKDYFLNEAQDRFVKQRYGKNNLYKAGFEEIQKRTEDLKSLVVTNNVNTTAVTYEDNTVRVDIDTLPAGQEYMFYLRCRALLTKDNCDDKLVGVKLVQQDDLNRVLADPFNRPRYGWPVAYFEDRDIFVLSDGTFTIPSVRLTYLKRPAQMNLGTYGQPLVQCELSEYVHKEIVQLAADIILENIESNRIQTIKQQLASIE